MNKGTGVSRSKLFRIRSFCRDLGLLVPEGAAWRIDFHQAKSLTRRPPSSTVSRPVSSAVGTGCQDATETSQDDTPQSQDDTSQCHLETHHRGRVLSVQNQFSSSSSQSWDEVEEELHASGVNQARTAWHAIRSRGAKPADAAAQIAAWRSRREQFGPFAIPTLFRRLKDVWHPGLSVDEGWPDPCDAWLAAEDQRSRLRDAEAVAKKARDRRDEFERGLAQRRAEEELSDRARELWEALTAQQREQLAVAALGPHPMVMRRFRADSFESRLARDFLIPLLIPREE